MRRHITLVVATWLVGGALAPAAALAQKQQPLILAFYAPSIPFKDTASRQAYLTLLADAIKSNTGREVQARLYGSLKQLRAASPDFAIVEPQCESVSGWRPIATAKIAGKTTRGWALFAASGESMTSLRKKKLAYGESGCDDKDFIENVIFLSEIRLSYFRATSPKPTVTGAVAEVASVRAAQAVFAPEGLGGGLTRLFSVEDVPNPILVASSSVGKGVTQSVEQAVHRFGSSGIIDGWAPVARGAQQDLARRMRGTSKTFVQAELAPLRLPLKEMLQAARGEAATVPVRGYFDIGEKGP